MRCMDKYIIDHIKGKELSEITLADFDFKKFDLKSEHLKSLSKELIEMRCDLFLKFTKQYMSVSNGIDLTGKVKKGSLTFHLLRCKALALNSAKEKVLQEQIQSFCNSCGG